MTSKRQVYNLSNSDVISLFLDSIDFNYSVIDKEGNYLVQNNQMISRISGGALKAQEIDAPSWENCQQVMQAGQKVTVEEQFNDRCFLSIKQPMFKNGECIGIRVLSYDITDRKQSEVELAKARKAAEVANEAKTEFLKNMRHDLRTPLTGVQGFAELISIKSREPKVKEYADNLVVSCRALTNIHNQILHAIEAFSGDIKIYRNKFNLQDVLETIVNVNLAKIREKNLRFELDFDPEIPKYVIGDCRRFGGIFLELFTNALKYTHRGFVHISAILERKAVDSQKIILKLMVQDSGIGIDEAKKEEIFTRFSRLVPTYEGKYEGLGLGLSIVKQFIDDLKGEVYVASELNKGSTFTCFIPFEESLSTGDEGITVATVVDDILFYPEIEHETFPTAKACYNGLSYAAEVPFGKIPQAKRVSKRFLVVEDDEVCAMVAQGVLQNMGHKVDVAFDGEEALQYYTDRSKTYDLIFMDIGLPGISGNEVTRRIRIAEKSTNKHVPIIALTAHVDAYSKQQCVESGMDAVLSKPVAGDQIVAIVNAFVRERKPAVVPQPKPVATLESLSQLEGPIMDIRNVQIQLGYDDKMLAVILERAKPALEKYLASLQEGLANSDWQLVQHNVHKIAGFCSYCGAVRLRTICQRVEDRLMSNEFTFIKELCDIVMKEAADVIKALDEFEL